jgi:hypothetical protein
MIEHAAVDHALRTFAEIYIGGIPPTITDESAYLSFISVLSGIEALAHYVRPDVALPGERFRSFVGDYFVAPYPDLADDLWKFRNGIVHAFNPGPFALVHQHSHRHLARGVDGVILNAEDFYAAFVFAFRKYATDLEASSDLQGRLLRAIEQEGGIAAIGKGRAF